MRSSIATTRVGGRVRINLGTKEVETGVDDDHDSETDIKSRDEEKNINKKKQDVYIKHDDNGNVRLVVDEREDNNEDLLYIQKVMYDCLVYVCGFIIFLIIITVVIAIGYFCYLF